MVFRKIIKMVKITTRRGKKGKMDRVIYVDDYRVTGNDILEQITRLVNRFGEGKIRKEFGLENFKHRSVNTKKWTPEETKKIFKMMCQNEDRLYPKSKSNQGSDYFKGFISRMIFRYQKRKKHRS